MVGLCFGGWGGSGTYVLGQPILTFVFLGGEAVIGVALDCHVYSDHSHGHIYSG